MIDPKTLNVGDTFTWNEKDEDVRVVILVDHGAELVVYNLRDQRYNASFHDQDWLDAVILSRVQPKPSGATQAIASSLYDRLGECLADATTLVTSLHLSGTDEELKADRAEDCTFKTVRELKDIIGRLRRFKERAYGDNDD